MIISEVMAHLARVLSEHGDIEVRTVDGEGDEVQRVSFGRSRRYGDETVPAVFLSPWAR